MKHSVIIKTNCIDLNTFISKYMYKLININFYGKE